VANIPSVAEFGILTVLWREENKEDAVKVFESNSAVHASSSNGWDSLAEGYEALGDVAWL